MAVMTPIVPDELTTFFDIRKNLYQFIHFLFQKPVYERTLLELNGYRNINTLSKIYDGGIILSKFFHHLSKYNIQDVQEDYQHLFLGPGPLVAPPWESYYRSKDFPIFKKWNSQVRKRYERFGLIFLKENNEPDDHLLFELEYLIFLINSCLQKPEQDILFMLVAEQISFIENHLVKWIPLFCQKVIDCSNSQLYVGAAILLSDFLGSDLDSLHTLGNKILK